MTSDRKADANRRNALRSTGPRTQTGKRRVSRNSTKHGLTGALPMEEVLAWYRVFMGDENARIKPFDQDRRARAALNLAEAQVQLQRVRRAEAKLMHELMLEADPVSVPDAEEDLEKSLEERVAEFLDQRRSAADASAVGGAGRLDAVGQLKKLLRYRNEAESRRRRALHEWGTVQ